MARVMEYYAFACEVHLILTSTSENGGVWDSNIFHILSDLIMDLHVSNVRQIFTAVSPKGEGVCPFCYQHFWHE